MGARSRRKGAVFEREVAELFRQAGVPAERNLSECRTGNAGDLELAAWCPLSVQVKVGERPNVWEAIREAQESAGETLVPVAILRRNGRGSRPPEDLAVLPLDEFLDLVRGLRAAGWW
ncbi:MAG TPA: hypothetical protein VLH75_20590 [Longimicrobiales bacterium]|nr:hypothetical protein [Longimicrobiales bacterium]